MGTGSIPESDADQPLIPVGVVTALPDERRCLPGAGRRAGSGARLSPHLLAVAGGVGAEHARRAAFALVEAGARALLSFGVAAGLDPALVTGTLLLPATLIATDGTWLTPDPDWRRRWLALGREVPIVEGPLAETTRVLVDAADKRRLRQPSGAVAADMGSAAVLDVARSCGVPGMVVRVVLDDARRALPQVALGAFDARGGVSAGAVLAGLLRHPGELPALWRLAAEHRVALRRLREVARLAFGIDPVSGNDDGWPRYGQNSAPFTAAGMAAARGEHP